MYFIAHYNKGNEMAEDNDDTVLTNKQESSWSPSVKSPEWVIVKRAAALAKRSYQFMLNRLKTFDDADWSAIFCESTTAFKSYSGLFRVNPDFLYDESSSSTNGDLGLVHTDTGHKESAYTRSMKARSLGPKALRLKNYRNLQAASGDGVIHGWRTIQECVDALRARFSQQALFFFNELSPEVIGLVWRPGIFAPMKFSVMNSDFARPMEEDDNLIVRNASDVFREMSAYFEDIVVTVKVFDESSQVEGTKKKRKLGA